MVKMTKKYENNVMSPEEFARKKQDKKNKRRGKKK